MIRSLITLLAAGVVLAGGCTAQRLARPRPGPVEPPAPGAIDRAIRRGAEFLIARQNPNGSWGSARRTKGRDILAPVPGSHRSFRAAVTGLCVSALIEAGGNRPEVVRAIERGEAYLAANLPKLRRDDPTCLYNVWAHAYGIRALARMYDRIGGDTERRRRILALAAGQVDFLRRFEALGGGWGYYEFGYHTQRPAGQATSFTTSTILIALHEARRIGADVPQALVDRAIARVRNQQNPDFAYTYREGLMYRRAAGINRPPGSLGRSQVCNLALRLWGDTRITDDVISAWLDRLCARNGWLSRARKFPIPHESWFAVAGYFFYYGHFYGAGCIEQLPAERRGFYQDHLARILMGIQEKDGSWWDFILYDYHQQYGTAMAMMSLQRCRRRVPAEALARTKRGLAP